MRKKIILGVAGLAAVALLAAYVLTRKEPADTRFTGAYLLEDGSPVLITPREGNVLRWRTMDGESAPLWPVGGTRYEGGGAFAEREPVVNTIEFQMERGRPVGFQWVHAGGVARQAYRMQLAEDIVFFKSGEIELRGKLVAPQGSGPYPAVVLVHGSEAYSAVDYYFEPYLYAAHGIAAFVFDKRGTGGSEGEYLQNFDVLSDDVVAAVDWLRLQERIDGARIHLAGFSQGGWIAPLAAKKDGHIRSLLIGYGVLVPVTAEDRWGYVYALRQHGFGEDAIAQVDRINQAITDIVIRHEDRWEDLAELTEAARGAPWFDTLKASDSMAGFVASSDLPMWMMRLYTWWRMGPHRDPPFIDLSYDPVPTMAALDVPSLWILAGEDSSAPAQWTLDELKTIQASGRPIEYVVYPDAEHGMFRFAEDGGERKLLGYERDYFGLQVEWLRRQSGLDVIWQE